MSEQSQFLGQPINFDEDAYINVAKMLIDADEVERALTVLSSVPAFYRDNRPAKIEAFKREIQRYLVTAHGYMTDAHDCDICDEAKAKSIVSNTLRGRLIARELEQIEGKVHVVEVGPGEYWLPIGLDRPFTYTPVAMDTRVFSQAKEHVRVKSRLAPTKLSDVTRVFVACEVIEHISNPAELAWECNKYFEGLEPHYIHLSTPLYTYDSRPKDWEKHKLPHLRAYTPSEFLAEASKIFPGYIWQIYFSPVMSIRGIHRSLGEKPSLNVD